MLVSLCCHYCALKFGVAGSLTETSPLRVFTLPFLQYATLAAINVNATVALIVGTCPSFMKIPSIINSIECGYEQQGFLNFSLVHVGRYYDYFMSGSFFKQLDIPEPNFNLGLWSDLQAQQNAGITLSYDVLLSVTQSLR